MAGSHLPQELGGEVAARGGAATLPRHVQLAPFVGRRLLGLRRRGVAGHEHFTSGQGSESGLRALAMGAQPKMECQTFLAPSETFSAACVTLEMPLAVRRAKPDLMSLVRLLV